MVRNPLDYEYSSYGLYMNDMAGAGKGRPHDELIKSLIKTDRVLNCFRYDSREQYRVFVEGKISHAEQELLIQKDIGEDDMWLPW